MNEEKVKSAVFYILERAENKEILIGKTRLIKLLDLLDIESYRSNQEGFTGLDWIFYKYGPYAFEIERFLDENEIIEESINIEGGKFFSKLKKEFDEEEVRLDIETKAIIGKLIDNWGTADLNELLDYVYFETEPMNNVEYTQALDLSKVKTKPEIKKIELSPKTKAKLEELGKRIKEQLEKIEISESYFWKEEIKDLSKLSGKVKVKNE
jgi:hypothetical protein